MSFTLLETLNEMGILQYSTAFFMRASHRPLLYQAKQWGHYWWVFTYLTHFYLPLYEHHPFSTEINWPQAPTRFLYLDQKSSRGSNNTSVTEFLYYGRKYKKSHVSTQFRQYHSNVPPRTYGCPNMPLKLQYVYHPACVCRPDTLPQDVPTDTPKDFCTEQTCPRQQEYVDHKCRWCPVGHYKLNDGHTRCLTRHMIRNWTLSAMTASSSYYHTHGASRPSLDPPNFPNRGLLHDYVAPRFDRNNSDHRYGYHEFIRDGGQLHYWNVHWMVWLFPTQDPPSFWERFSSPRDGSSPITCQMSLHPFDVCRADRSNKQATGSDKALRFWSDHFAQRITYT